MRPGLYIAVVLMGEGVGVGVGAHLTGKQMAKHTDLSKFNTVLYLSPNFVLCNYACPMKQY